MARLSGALLAAAIGAFAVTAAERADAADCSLASGVATITGSSAPWEDILVAASPSGAIAVNGSPCGSATADPASQITVVINDTVAGKETDLYLWLGAENVSFESSDERGSTRAEGSSRVRLLIDLGDGDSDALGLLGDPDRSNFFRSGTEGIDVTGDGSPELTGPAGGGFPAGIEFVFMDGGNGNDLLRAGGGLGTGGPSPVPHLIEGDGGDDSIGGGSEDDDLSGDGFGSPPGNDLIDGGGDGILGDTVDYTGASGPVSINLRSSSAQGTGSDGVDTIRDVENVTGSEFDDALNGTHEDNLIIGLSGADLIRGGLGNDQLWGGGFDAEDGSEAELAALLAGDDDTIFGEGGSDSLDGEHGDDRLRGGPQADFLTGGTRNDLLSGGAGRDTLLGLGGLDRLLGRDRVRDKKISCGPGADRRESATFDARGKKPTRDAKPTSC